MNEDPGVVLAGPGSGDMRRWRGQQGFALLAPRLHDWEQVWDRRRVQTVLDLGVVLVMQRQRNHGLVLSKCEEQWLGAARAPAGVQRIAPRGPAARWPGTVVEALLWKQADHRLQELRDTDQVPYVLGDASGLEKPESVKAERSCAVRSSQAGRLKRIKPG